jgi:hypothetical protein
MVESATRRIRRITLGVRRVTEIGVKGGSRKVIYVISPNIPSGGFGGSKTTSSRKSLDEAELIGGTGEEGFKEAVAIHVGSVEAEPLFSPDEKMRPHNLGPSAAFFRIGIPRY